jgi:hypothetical protein
MGFIVSFKFIGTLTQNDSFRDQSTELEISKAKIELTLEDIDSVARSMQKYWPFRILAG